MSSTSSCREVQTYSLLSPCNLYVTSTTNGLGPIGVTTSVKRAAEGFVCVCALIAVLGLTSVAYVVGRLVF